MGVPLFFSYRGPYIGGIRSGLMVKQTLQGVSGGLIHLHEKERGPGDLPRGNFKNGASNKVSLYEFVDSKKPISASKFLDVVY